MKHLGDTRGKNIRDTTEEYFANFCVEMVRKTLADNQQQQIEYEYTLENRTYYYQGYLAPFKDIDTDEQLVVWIAFDITERKQVERALRESEQRYRGLFEQTNDAVFIVSLDLIHLAINQRAADMLGYEVHELIGTPTSVIVAASNYSDSLSTIQALKASEHIAPYERILQRKDGSEFPVEVNLSLVRDTVGNPLHIQSVIREITERKQLEQVIRESEKRFRSLIEKSSDLVITVDKTGIITYTSPASLQVTTYSEAEILGQNVLTLFNAELSIHTDPTMRQQLEDMLNNVTKDSIQLEVPLKGKAGQVVWLRGVLTNLLDDPDIGAIVVNIHNVTALKQAVAREQQESNFVKVLLELATVQHEGHHLHHVLERILAQLSLIFPNDGIHIMLLEDEIGKVVAVAGYQAEKMTQMMHHKVNFTEFATFQHILRTKKPLLVPETKSNSIWTRREITDDINCYLGVPILLANKVIGIINLHQHTAYSFNDEVASRIYAIASYIAVVIHNFQAYEDVKERTIREERQHLARELHDAVSQTLFSASMISETLPRLLEHDLSTVRTGLGELTTLTKGALAEMRLLLIELRPSALTETALNVLLDNLINGFKARIDAQFDVDLICTDTTLLPNTKLALYRVAQEALSNVMKHAHPQHIRVICHCQPPEVELIIADDGVGFDTNTIPAAHFGLNIMRERAEQAGLILTIQTEPGCGTTVRLNGRI